MIRLKNSSHLSLLLRSEQQKKYYRMLSISLLVFFISTAFFTNISTVYAQSNSDEKADLEIFTEEEFKEFNLNVNNGNNYNGKVVKLMNDIELELSSNDIQPFSSFHGTFDGGGHTISGISFNYKGNVCGLFSLIGHSGIVKNLTVVSSDIKNLLTKSDSKTSQYFGGIAGINDGKIINCHIDANLETDYGFYDSDYNYYIGGIAGWNNGDIVNCSNKSNMKNTHGFVGGITGYNYGTISNSFNLGNLLSDDISGGVVCTNIGTIQNCYNTGTFKTAGIAYENKGVISNTYCSDSSAPQVIYKSSGTEKNSGAMNLSQIMNDAFVTTLNSNRGKHTDWLAWTKTDLYPSLIKQYEVLFLKTNDGITSTNYSTAASNALVTLTATPKNGFYISNLSIKTTEGLALTSKKKGNSYSFTMPSSNVMVSTIFKELRAPKGVKLSLNTKTSVKLQWEKVEGATGYEVYRSTNKSSGFKKVTSTNDLTYTNKSVSAGKTYYYKIRAIYKSGSVTSYSKPSDVKKIINRLQLTRKN